MNHRDTRCPSQLAKAQSLAPCETARSVSVPNRKSVVYFRGVQEWITSIADESLLTVMMMSLMPGFFFLSRPAHDE
jgi:hypothetical protein